MGVPYMVQVVAVNGSQAPAVSEYSTRRQGHPQAGSRRRAWTVTPGTGWRNSGLAWSEVTGATDGYTVQWRLENGQYSSDDEHEIHRPVRH